MTDIVVPFERRRSGRRADPRERPAEAVVLPMTKAAPITDGLELPCDSERMTDNP